MSNAVNAEIRETAKRSGVKLWQVAEEIGMSDAGKGAFRAEGNRDRL